LQKACDLLGVDVYGERLYPLKVWSDVRTKGESVLASEAGESFQADTRPRENGLGQKEPGPQMAASVSASDATGVPGQVQRGRWSCLGPKEESTSFIKEPLQDPLTKPRMFLRMAHLAGLSGCCR
jgi:hypothetical protein